MIIVGYQSEGSLGRMLIDGVRHVKIFSLNCLSLAQPRGIEPDNNPDLFMPLVEGVQQING